MVRYGRSDEEWDLLADAGLAFLAERACLAKLTSYTELNATLERRTGLPGFDFSRADERAAMGHLLLPDRRADRRSTGLMISALVTYLDANDAGTRFYVFAQELGLLSRKASGGQSWTSGSDRCGAPPVLLTALPRPIQAAPCLSSYVKRRSQILAAKRSSYAAWPPLIRKVRVLCFPA